MSEPTLDVTVTLEVVLQVPRAIDKRRALYDGEIDPYKCIEIDLEADPLGLLAAEDITIKSVRY